MAGTGSSAPLAEWPAADRRAIVGVLTDIDDTLTTDGAITPDALQALADLRAAGMRVVPITGRPVGWSEALINTWPVDAVVTENGAMALFFKHEKRTHSKSRHDNVLFKYRHRKQS